MRRPNNKVSGVLFNLRLILSIASSLESVLASIAMTSVFHYLEKDDSVTWNVTACENSHPAWK